MFKLDENFLVSLGLGAMPSGEKDGFLRHIYDELELRVGTALSEELDDQDLAYFQELSEVDPAASARWLQEHCPHYGAVVAQELAKLKDEIIAGKDRLLDQGA